MSDREKVLRRLETAVASLEAAAQKRLFSNEQASAGQDSGAAEQLNALTEERDRLSEQVREQSKHNADLGARLDKAIAKLNKVLEKA
ncbi:DUF4164 family protein [Hwanghaeella grinnelliae]|uniref:DUF4164 family protein n=1 Tax=Hwanghaeella grinnelliae TaxID=2500179 RepID=A0A3S2Z4R3_9PROT|nr:DUF4164 family protein [Hwanghaeella grinnelliae]RVU33772.1 DUF4164 family protein [Hwanghaeella grinnelliae]